MPFDRRSTFVLSHLHCRPWPTYESHETDMPGRWEAVRAESEGEGEGEGACGARSYSSCQKSEVWRMSVVLACVRACAGVGR
jgi:hypothetical protein